jgi:hypothetical protein
MLATVPEIIGLNHKSVQSANVLSRIALSSPQLEGALMKIRFSAILVAALLFSPFAFSRPADNRANGTTKLVKLCIYVWCDSKTDSFLDQTDEPYSVTVASTTGGLKQSVVVGPFDIRDGGNWQRWRNWCVGEFPLKTGESLNANVLLMESDSDFIGGASAMAERILSAAKQDPRAAVAAAVAGIVAGAKNQDDELGIFNVFVQNENGNLAMTVNGGSMNMVKEAPIKQTIKGEEITKYPFRLSERGRWHVALWLGPVADEPARPPDPPKKEFERISK